MLNQTTPTAPTPGPIKVDLLSAYLKTGMPFNQMFTNINPDDQVFIRPKEEYEKEFGSMFKNPQELNDLWDAANSVNDEYHKGKLYKKYSGFENISQAWGGQFKISGPDMIENPKTTPGITGKVTPLFSNSQIASAGGKVRDYKEDGSYTEKELNWYDRHIAAIYNPLMIDYEKNADGDSVPFLRFEKPGEYSVGMEQLSVWGPQEMYGKSILEAIPGFISAMTVELGAGVTTIAGAADYGIHRSTGDSKKDSEYHASLFSNIANMMNSLSYKPSVESQNESWFDSFGGTAYKLGQGIGMLMPQRLAAKLAMGSIKVGAKELAAFSGQEVAKMTKADLNQAAVKYAAAKGQSVIGVEGVNYIISRGSPKMAMAMAAGVGSVQALDDVYKTAVQNGIEKDDAVLLAMTASPFIYATERLIGAKWIAGLLGESGHASFSKAMKEAIQSSLSKGSNLGSDAGRIAVMKEVFGKVGKSIGSFAEIIKDAPISRGMVREGTQESLEESLYMAMESMYDRGAIPWIKDPKQFAVAGQGAYGTSFTDEKGLNRLKESAVGGAVLGGVFDSFTGNTRSKAQDDYINNQLVNGKHDELKAETRRALMEGKFGYEHYDWKNEPIYAGAEADSPVVEDDSLADYGMAKGYKIKTLNDMNAYNFARNIEMKKAFLDSTGITSADLLKRYIGNTDIVQEGVKDVEQIRKISTELSDASEQLKIATDNGEDTKVAELTPKVEKLTEELSKAKQDYQYHVGPISKDNQYSQYYHDKLTSSLAQRMNDNTNTPDALLTPRTVAERSDRLTQIQNQRIARQKQIEQQNQALEGLGNSINQDWKFDPNNAEASLADLNTKLSAVNKDISDNGLRPGDLQSVAKDKLTAIRDSIASNKGLAFPAGHDDFDYEEAASNKPLLESMKGVMSQLDNIISSKDNVSPRPAKAVYDEKTDHDTTMDLLIGDLEKQIDAKISRIEDLSGTADIEEVAALRKQQQEIQQLLNLNAAMLETQKKTGHNIYLGETEDVTTGKIGRDIPESVKKAVLTKFMPQTAEDIQKEGANLSAKITALEFAMSMNKELREKREFDRRKNILRHKFTVMNDIFSKFTDELKDVNKEELDKLAVKITNTQFASTDNDALINAEKILNRVETDVYKKIGGKVDIKRAYVQAFTNELKGIITFNGNQGAYYNSANELSFLTQDEFLSMSLDEVKEIIKTGKPDPTSQKPLYTAEQRNALISMVVMTYTNYANTILDTPTSNFSARLKANTEGAVANENEHIPSIQQQNVLRMLYSFMFSQVPFIANLKLTFKKNATDYSTEVVDEFKGKIFIVPADGGFGKTSIIGRSIFKMIDAFQQKSKGVAKIKVYTISNENHRNLISSTDKMTNVDHTMLNAYHDINSLTEDIASKTKLTEADYIIIDEASRLTLRQMADLAYAVEGTNTKIIMLGDPKQAVNNSGNKLKDNATVPMQEFGINSPYGSEKFRTGIFDIQSLIDAVNRTIKGVDVKEVMFPFTKHSKGTAGMHHRGVNQVNTVDDVKQAFKDQIMANAGEKVGIIFATNKEADEYAAEYEGTPAYGLACKFSRYIHEVPGYVSKHLNSDNKSVQSEELQASYVAMGPGTTISERKNFGTAISRAKRYVVIASGNSSNGSLVEWKDILDQSDPALKTDESKKADLLRKTNDKARIDKLADGESVIAATEPAAKNVTPSSTTTSTSTATTSDIKKGSRVMLIKRESPRHKENFGTVISVKKSPYPDIDWVEVKWDNGMTSTVNSDTITKEDKQKEETEAQLAAADAALGVISNGPHHGDTRPKGKVTTTKKHSSGSEWTFKIGSDIVSGTFIGFQKHEVYDGNTKTWTPITFAIISLNGTEQLVVEAEMFKANATAYKEPVAINVVEENTSDTVSGGYSSAQHFSDTGSLPTSMGISDPEPGQTTITSKQFFHKDRLADRLKILLNKRNYHFRVVFYRSRTVLAKQKDGNYGPTVLKNMLVVEAVSKLDDSVHVMSVFYEPMLNSSEKIDAPYTRASNHEKNRDGKPDPMTGKLNAYSNAVRSMFEEGFANTNDSPTGGKHIFTHEVSVSPDLIRGKVKYTANYETKDFHGFMESMIDKGLVFQTSSGTATKDIKNVHVEMRVKPNKGVDYYAYVSYDGQSWTAIELKAPEIKSTDNIDDILDSISELKKSLKTKLPDEFNTELNSSLAYQFLLSNKRLLLKGNDIADKFKGLLTLDSNGFIGLAAKTQDNFDAKREEELVNLEKAVKVLKSLAKGDTKVYKWIKTRKSNTANIGIIDDASNMLTAATDVMFPQLSVKVSPAVSAGPSSGTSIGASLGFGELKLSKDSVDGADYHSVEEEISYLESVLGTTFVNNPDKLGLEPSLLSMDGKALYGVVRNGKMILEAIEGREALKGVGRHEAIHYILRHLLSPESCAKVYRSTRWAMKQQGYKGNISDKAAEEFLAEVNRGTQKLTVDKNTTTGGFMQKFISWFNGVIRNIRAHGDAAEQFLSQVNNGTFKDMSPIYNIGSNYESTLAKESEQPLSMKKGSLSISQQIQRFGSSEMYERAKRSLTNSIISNSNYNRKIKVLNAPTIIEAITERYHQINKARIDHDLDNKFGNQSRDKISFPEKYDDKSEVDAFIVWKLSLKENFDALMAEILPTLNFDEETIETIIKYQYGDSQSFDVRQTISTALKLHMGSIPSFNWTTENGNPRIVSRREGEYVRYSILEKAFITSVFEARASRTTEGTDLQFLDDVFMAMRKLADKYSKDGVENETRDAIYSFLDVFARDFVTSETHRVGNENVYAGDTASHYHLAFQLPQLLRNILNNEDSEQSRQAAMATNAGQIIMAKHKASAGIMAALYSHFISMQRQDLSYTEVRKKKDGVSIKVVKAMNTTSDIIKNEFKAAVNWLTPSGDYIKNYKSAINGDKGFRLEEKSTADYGNVFAYGKQILTAIPNTDGSFRYEFSQETVAAEDIRSMFLKVFHMNVPIDVIRIILGQKAKSVVDNMADAMTKDELANMLGHMFLTISANENDSAAMKVRQYLGGRSIDAFDDITEEDIETEENEGMPLFDVDGEYQLSLEEERAIAAAKKAKEASLTEQEKRLRTPKLTNFDIEFNKIAKIQEVLFAKLSKGFTFGATGTKYYTNVLGHYLSDLFGQKTGLGYASDVVTEKVNRIISKVADLSMTALATRDPKTGEIIYNNPLMRYRDKMKIERLSYTTGIRNKYSGKDVNSLNKHDYLSTVINGYFSASVFNRNKFQTLDFSLENLSDSSVFPIVSVSFDTTGSGNNKLITVHRNAEGKVTSLTVNEAMINDNIIPIVENHLKANEISIHRWITLPLQLEVKNFGTANPFSMNRTELIDRVKAIDTLSKKINSFCATLDSTKTAQLVNMLNQAGMVINRDYKIVNGKIVAGNATTMNHDVYNAENCVRFKIAYDLNVNQGRGQEKVVSDILDQIFSKRFKAFTDDLTANQIKQDTRIPSFSERGSQYIKPRTANGQLVKRGKQQMYDWNPFYKAYYYGQHIISGSVSELAFGPENQFTDSRAMSKYHKNGIASGWKMLTGTARTLGTTSKIVKIRDIKEIWDDAKNLFGINDSVESTDGHILISPLEAAFVVESTGGNDSMVSYTDSVLKRVGYGVDYEQGLGSFIKSSELKLNGDLIDNSKAGMAILEYFLTGGDPTQKYTFTGSGKEQNLFEIYKDFRAEGKSHHEAIMDLKELIIMDRIATNGSRDMLSWTIGGFHMQSTHKIADGGLNDFNPFDSGSFERGEHQTLQVSTMDNTKTVLQLNPFHEHDKVASIKQQEAGIGVMDSEAAMKIDNANAALARKNFKHMMSSIKKEGLIPYLRRISVEGVERMTHASSIIEIVNDLYISMRHPVLRDKALMELKAKFNLGIQTKRTGRKLIQQHDKLLEFVESFDDEGNSVLKSLSELSEDDKAKSLTRNLRHTTFKDNQGRDIGKLMELELEALQSSGADITSEAVLEPLRKKYRAMIQSVNPGEVVIPAETIEDFINTTYIQNRADLAGNKQPTLNQLLSIRFKGLNLNVRSYVKANSANYNQSKEDGFIALEKKLKGDLNISAAQRTEILSFYRALLPKLEVYYSRIPATMPSAGSVGEVVGITYDSKGVIYTSPVKNLLDGSDYDVDTLTMYMRAHRINNQHEGLTDNEGNPLPELMRIDIESYDEGNLEGTSEDGINNYIFDTMFHTYVDSANLDFTMRSLTINDMKERVQKKKDKDLPHSHDIRDNAENFVNSHEGKRMVSRMANGIQAYSRLLHMPENLRASIIKFPILKYVSRLTTPDPAQTGVTIARTEFVIDNLAKILQASVDNAKELIIGYLNINTTSGNLVTALVMSDMTLDEIYDFLETPTVIAAITEAARSESAENTRVQLMDIVDRKLRTYEEMLRDENLKDRKAQFLLYHSNAAKFYEDLANGITKSIEEGSVEDIGNDQIYDWEEQREGDSFSLESRFSLPTEAEFLEEHKDDLKLMNRKNRYLARAKYHRTKIVGQEKGFAEMVTRMENSQAQLAIMQKMGMKGEAIRRITKIFSLASGHTGTDFDTYKLINEIEFITGHSIDQILSGSNAPADGWKRSTAFKSDKGRNRGSYQVKDQQSLNIDMGKIFGDIFDSMKVPAGINVSFVANGEDGMSQGLITKAAEKFPVTLHMSKGRRMKNRFGQILYNNSPEALQRNVLDRFPGLKPENVTVSEGDQAWEGLKDNASKSAITVIVYSNDGKITKEMQYSRTIAGDKAIVIDMNKPLEPQLENARKRIAAEMEKAAINNFKDIDINLVGNNLFDLLSQNESPKQTFERRETEIRAMVDYTTLIRSLPNIMEYLNQLNEYVNLTSKEFFQNSIFGKEFLESLAARQMFDKIPSAEMYFKVMDAMSSFIADMYFSGMTDSEAQVTMQTIDQLGMATTPISFDLRNKNDRDLFTAYFPQYIMDLKHSSSSLAKNGFIRAMGMIDQNIGMPDSLSMTPDQVMFLTNQFAQLEKDNPELAHYLHLYNLMRYKFEYQKGSMTQMMGTSFMRKISPVIDQFHEMLVTEESDLGPNEMLFRESLMTTGQQNILVHYPEFWKFFKLDKFKEEGLFPEVAYSSENGYRQVMLKEPALGPNSIPVYGKAADMSSNKDRSLTPDRSTVSVETRNGSGAVINLQGQDLIDFRRNGETERSFRRKHNYKNGQIVYVNGIVSEVVTVYGNTHKIILRAKPDGVVSSKKLSMRARRINSAGFKVIMAKLQKAFPMMTIHYVDNNTTRKPGLKAYFENGMVYYNTDLVTMDSPVHELAHPILEVLRTSDNEMGQAIYSAIMSLVDNEINTDSPLYRSVKAAYPELSDSDFRFEMGATILGFRSVKQVMAILNQGQDNMFAKVHTWVKEAYDWFMTGVLKAMGYSDPSGYFKKIDALSASNATLGTLVDEFIGSILAGNVGNGLTAMQSETLRGMKAAASRDLSVPLTNIKGMENDLLTSATTDDVNTLKDEETVNTIYNAVLTTKDNEFVLFGKTYEFAATLQVDQTANNNGLTTKDRIRKEILPVYSEMSKDKDKRIKQWLNGENDTNGFGRTDEATIKKLFTYGEDADKRMFSESILQQLKQLFGYNYGDKVIRYSEIANEFPEMSQAFDASLVGNDPWIIVHRSGIKNGKSTFDVSLFDLNYMSLSFHPTHGTGNTNVLANYIDDSQAESLSIGVKNTLKGVKKLELGIVGLKLAEMNPDINIRRVGVVTMYGGEAKASMIDMADLSTTLLSMKEIPEFMDRLPQAAKVLLEKESLKDKDFSPDFMMQLYNMMDEALEYLESVGKSSPTLESQVKLLQEYLYSSRHTVNDKKALVAMLRTRQRYLSHRRENPLNSMDRKIASDEYRFISKVLSDLNGYDRDPLKKNKGSKTNRFNYNLQNLSNVSNEIEQNLYGKMKDTLAIISGLFDKLYKSGLKDAFDKINDAYFTNGNARLLKAKGFVVDDSEARCKNMWIWSNDDPSLNVYNEVGEAVNVNLRRIHWNVNDPITAKKLRDGKISLQEVQAGEIIAQRVEDDMKKLIRHQILRTDWNQIKSAYWEMNKSTGTLEVNEAAISAAVDSKYNAVWQKGMMPVVNKSMSSMFFEGKMLSAAKMKSYQITHPEEIFDEIISIGDEESTNDGVRSIFQRQILNVTDNRYGGSQRMQMMGLTIQGGKTIYRDTNKTKALLGKKKGEEKSEVTQSMLSDNLEHILDNFGMDVLNKIHLEEEFMPAVQDARIALKAVMLVDNIDPIRSEKRLKTIVDRIVHNKMQPLDDAGSKAGKVAENAINFLQRLTSYSGVAFSIPTAEVSLVSNWMQSITLAIASTLGGDAMKTFNVQQFGKAIGFMVQNIDLCEQLMGMYQVSDRDRYNLTNSSRFKQLKNNITNERAPGYLNWATDYAVRMQVMIAQMMYDGTLEAHSLDADGKVVYDEKKDRRFWNADGSRNAVQAELNEWVKEELNNDPRYNQSMDQPLQAAYMVREQRKLKWISDQFIVGSYSADDMPAGMSHIENKVLSQFRIFLYSMAEVRFGGKKYVTEGGTPIVIENEDGTTTRQWFTPERKGAYVEIADMAKEIYRERKVKDWKAMTDMEKHNLIRVCQDMVVLCAAALMGWGMWEDKKKKGKAFMPESRMLRGFKSGVLSVLSVNPMEAIGLFASIPIVKTTQSILNIMTFRATQQDVRQLTPGKATYDTFTDFSTMWDEEEKPSVLKKERN